MLLNVLIVDDSVVMRRIIMRALLGSGLLFCDIHEAENGIEGLEALKTHNDIDFVLSDIHMPVMNGEEMVDQMRKDFDLEKMPVVFISSEKNENRITVLTRKGTGFIKKPFTPKLLGKAIMDLLGGKSEPSNNGKTL